ncbi:2Fe-2S iron-sulfur cluster-binding protein [Streptomyces sp. NBC_01808]|uniref:(2Fe-2S)-binding protein n=1 Tax=Streptomyces sp. NBC_01808 TaxID=2975947 RepID=UPI002DD83074|nr:2Fe-2S iron-sulfur cluster-binding protein [Streptomyces sp. NBC_01808]WSA36133.1 2Fe-2S iron-sulfur cluster-binding protein [Streptomyces sp. NBC_01808]
MHRRRTRAARRLAARHRRGQVRRDRAARTRRGRAADGAKACTSHLNGKAVNPCAVPVGDLRPTDEVTTIEGLADTVDEDLHPMQQAWLDHDVVQCGYCQPGQIMAAVALVRRVAAEGREITDDDLDGLRNICRCGTYVRIREAIRAGAEQM